MNYMITFLVGGLLCGIGQIFIDRTALTPAKILTGYVVGGVILTAVGLYEPLVKFAGAGATVPLTGFGYLLAKGAGEGVAKDGLSGALGGGIVKTAVGVGFVIIAAVIVSVFFKAKGTGK